jgi:hypothetical protein
LEAILEAIFAVEIRQREEEDAGEKGFQYRIVGSIGVYGFIYMGLFTLEDGSPHSLHGVGPTDVNVHLASRAIQGIIKRH